MLSETSSLQIRDTVVSVIFMASKKSGVLGASVSGSVKIVTSLLEDDWFPEPSFAII